MRRIATSVFVASICFGFIAAPQETLADKILPVSGIDADSSVETAVARTLRWLKKHQAEDGSWDGKTGGNDRFTAKTPCTAFALLTFLAHGETPKSREFGDTVEGAIEYLLASQKEDGRFLNVDGHEYGHPIAAYALCESYEKTNSTKIKEAAEKAIAVIVKGQNQDGCWNYNLKASSRNDTSYTSWCVQALQAARSAGLDVEGLDQARAKAVLGLKKIAHPQGGFGYTTPAPAHGLTGAGVYCLTLLGEQDSPEVKLGLKAVSEHSKVSWSAPKGKIYYWYHDTAALFRNGGAMWEDWSAQLAPEMVSNQVVVEGEGEHGEDTGYWDAPANTKSHCPRFVNTCLCAISLQVYDR